MIGIIHGIMRRPRTGLENENFFVKKERQCKANHKLQYEAANRVDQCVANGMQEHVVMEQRDIVFQGDKMTFA
ncbi:MAG: hypothetical protein ACLRSV_05750 [Oscillospiraceae bacterium]